jgi:hypothetical protein
MGPLEALVAYASGWVVYLGHAGYCVMRNGAWRCMACGAREGQVHTSRSLAALWRLRQWLRLRSA